MYSLDVTKNSYYALKRDTVPAKEKKTENTFKTELAAAERTAEQESETLGPRKLTETDVAIQKDIQEAFGIEPYQPGDSLLSAIDSFWPFHSSKKGSVSITDIAGNVDAATSIFQKHLSGFLQENGIPTQPKIELSVGNDGKVNVQSGHPEKEKIEEFINGNFEMRNLFVGISSTKSFLAMAEESMEFQKKYAIDPKAAVAEYSHLFTGKYGYDTSLIINNGIWEFETTEQIHDLLSDNRLI